MSGQIDKRYVLVLDEGTTSTRAMLFALDGRVAGVAQQELTQYHPHPGYVEHDAHEIWDKTLDVARQMVAQAGGAAHILAIGITNQRETVVAWDRTTGKPLCRAIVWQDRRTAEKCAQLVAQGMEPMVQQRTGLVLDPYFSGSKLGWIMDNVPEARAMGDRLALGTMESWLVWNLTGQHITDASNASRTMLMALDGQGWDAQLCVMFGVPMAALPEIVGCAEMIGQTRAELFGAEIAITGLAGDQQAAVIGQGCLTIGDTKATFGTGAFVLTNMGQTIPRSNNRLLTTVLSDIGGVRSYALEGSVFVAGSLIQWLRDNLGLIAVASDSERLARSVADNGGVVIVPALSGLGAPHWLPHARAVISGMSFATTSAHIIRAALEALAHQTSDLARAFADDGAPWKLVRIDGGMAANGFVAQDLADILALPVERPLNVETTARGAAMLAAVGAGAFAGLAEAAAAMLPEVEHFDPVMLKPQRHERLAAWRDVFGRMVGAADPVV